MLIFQLESTGIRREVQNTTSKTPDVHSMFAGKPSQTDAVLCDPCYIPTKMGTPQQSQTYRIRFTQDISM